MRRGGIALVLAGVGLGIGPGTTFAQRLEPINLAVGGGVGVTQSARAKGQAYHAAVNFPLKALPWPEPGPWDERRRRRVQPTAHLRAEVFYQGGTVTGARFSCERVDPFYCLGRSDENRIAGAAVFVRVAMPSSWRMQFYLDPIGAGIYHRHTKSEELQGPTALCVIDGAVVSCPNNPGWATVEYRSSRMSIGANTGGGMLLQVGGVRLFAEARAHKLFESGESFAGALPVTVGVSF